MQERLQKYLARCGAASRRRAEGLITQGRVSVNGKRVTQLGSKVKPASDTVSLDGKIVSPPQAPTYVAVHKPVGYLTTRDDPHGRPTVRDLLPAQGPRLAPVGRLDSRSEGLLFLTNDGEWAHRVAHPRFGGEKEYAVLVNGALSPRQLDALRGPLVLDGYQLNPVCVRVMKTEGEATWLAMTLTEGRKRQIRRMLAAVGKRAARLIRVRIGPVRLGSLGPGKLRPLTEAEIGHWPTPRRARTEDQAEARSLASQDAGHAATTCAKRARHSPASTEAETDGSVCR